MEWRDYEMLNYCYSFQVVKHHVCSLTAHLSQYMLTYVGAKIAWHDCHIFTGGIFQQLPSRCGPSHAFGAYPELLLCPPELWSDSWGRRHGRGVTSWGDPTTMGTGWTNYDLWKRWVAGMDLLASFPGSPLTPTKNKNGGGEPGIDSHLISWHNNVTVNVVMQLCSHMIG